MNMVANQGGIISPGLTLWLADLRGRAASLLMAALIALCGGGDVGEDRCGYGVEGVRGEENVYLRVSPVHLITAAPGRS